MAKAKGKKLKARKRAVKDLSAKKSRSVKGGAISQRPSAVKLS